MQHEKLVVVDIETVPDGKVESTREFPLPAFHQIVAIAFLEADIHRRGSTESFKLRELRAGGEQRFQERELLQGFFQYIERLKPRIVTYNGRGFDLPVLKYRGMVHELPAPILHLSEYSYRYNTDSHCDLLEVLTDFGASTRMRLGDVCLALSIPSKLGMDGSEVAKRYREGNIRAIRNYCELDVLSTYLVYLRSMLQRGVLSTPDFANATRDVHQYLLEQRESRPHLSEFLNAWQYSAPPA